jgi:hypothetical protein
MERCVAVAPVGAEMARGCWLFPQLKRRIMRKPTGSGLNGVETSHNSREITVSAWANGRSDRVTLTVDSPPEWI